MIPETYDPLQLELELVARRMGLTLTGPDLGALLPVVRQNRQLLDRLRGALPPEQTPADLCPRLAKRS